MSRASWIGRALGSAVVTRVLDRAPAHTPTPSPSSVTPLVAPPRRVAATPPRIPPTPLTPSLDHAVVERPRPGPDAGASVDRLAAFMDRFCYYQGDHARQYKAVDKETGEITYGWARVGKRRPDECALTREAVEAHLRGQITAGTYLLDDADRCRLLVLDHDDKRTLPDLDPATGRRRVIEEDGLALLQDCRRRLEEQGIACAVSESRRGGHLFVFLDEPVPARDARALAMLALGTDEVERMHRGHEAFEIYPKQDRRTGQGGAGGTGSNIALPLGVHLKDGERHPFIDRHGETVAHTLSGQLDYVASIERCRAQAVLHARPWLYEELDRATHPVRARTSERAPEPTNDERQPTRAARATRTTGRQGQPSPIARWKDAYPLDVMLAQYGVHTPHSGSYQCPIAAHHADGRDSTPSLSVNLEMDSGVWFCHTANVGGDSLSLVQHMEGLSSPREALAFAQERWPLPEMERDDRAHARG